MLMDSQLLFSDAQAITTTAASTNVVDLTNARDIGVGTELQMLFAVGTAFTTDSTNASTLTISLQGSTNSTNSGFVDYVRSPAYTASDLAGSKIVLPVDWPALMRTAAVNQALPRYIRVNYTVGVASWAGGTLTASLLLGRDDNLAYPKNYTNAYPTT